MRYTIERIELKNFLSHIDTTLPLGRGITVLVGDNGAGKSSIVDAIFIQLYQPQRSGEYPRGGIRNLVNRTSPTDHALIKLGLRSQASTPTLLEITSKIPRQGSREARVLKVVGSQKKIIARRPTEARGVIARELGIHAEPEIYKMILENAVIIRQGKLESILDTLTSGHDGVKLLKTLFGVTAYREASEKIAELTLAGGYRVRGHENIRKEIENLQDKIRQLKRSITSIQKELEKLNKEKKTLEETLETMTKEAEALEGDYEEYNELKKEINKINSKIDNIKREIRHKKQEYHAKRCQQLKKEYREAMKILNNAYIDGERVDILLERYTSAKRQLEQQLRDMEDHIRKLEKYRRTPLQSLEKELLRIKGQIDSLRREKERVADTIRELESLKRELLHALREAGKLLGLPSTPQLNTATTVMKRLHEEIERLEREIDSKTGRKEELIRESSIMRSEAKRKKKTAELLLQGIERSEQKCPMCGRPLTTDEARHIAETLLKEAKVLLEQHEKLLHDARLLERDIEELKGRLERLKHAHTLLGQAIEKLKEKEVTPENLDEKIAEADQVMQEIVEKLNTLENRESTLHKELGRLEGLRKTLLEKGIDPDKTTSEELKARYKELEQELKEIMRKLEETESKLLEITGASTIDDARDTIKKAEQARLRGQSLLEKCTRLEAEIESLSQDLEESLKELDKQSERLKQVEPNAAKFESLQEEIKRLSESLQEIKTKIAAKEELISDKKEEIEKLQKEVNEKEKIYRKARLLYQVARDLFRRAEDILFQERLRLLEEEVSEILNEFQLDYNAARIRLKERKLGTSELDINLVSRTGVITPIDSLSGGERIAFALALVLALNRLLTGGVGFLVLDEPTTHLDSVRRRELIKVIEAFGRSSLVDQLIVVTHDREVMDAADVVYTVEKDPSRGSIVRRIEGV